MIEAPESDILHENQSNDPKDLTCAPLMVIL